MAVDMSQTEIDEFLLGQPTLILCINRPGKAPLPVPMAYGWRDGAAYMHTLAASPKVGLLKRNPTVSLIAEDSGTGYFSLKSVMVEGIAEVSEDPAVVDDYRRIIDETKPHLKSRRPEQWPPQLERFYQRPRAAIKVIAKRYKTWDFDKIPR